jgi:hypothetical protein
LANRATGVYFEYDFYALRIKLTEQPRPLLEFITRVCAVIGGFYVVLGFLYRSADWALDQLFPKRVNL